MMEIKEADWLLRRAGYISASMIDALMTPGRRKDQEWGQTVITYLYRLQYERAMGFPFITPDARPMRFGRENEEYAIEWIRENGYDNVINCTTDLEERLFRKHDKVMYGASPDAIVGTADNVTHIFEIKSVYSEKETCWVFSPTVPYEAKVEHILSEHGKQIAGLFLAFPECDMVTLVKYNPPRDDNPFDTKGILHPSRGIAFPFERDSLIDVIEFAWEKILYADALLNSGIDIDEINNINFQLTEPLAASVHQEVICNQR